nr:hypothetical protein [uncultured Sphingomonas sp.]
MKSLPDKLGYKCGVPALAWRVPEGLGEALAALTAAPQPSFLIAFVRNRAELAEAAVEVAASYRAGGHLWLAYPKKSGAIRSDLDRDHGWEPLLAMGLLAVTQVALNQDWSALRFRFREEIRLLRRRSEQG